MILKYLGNEYTSSVGPHAESGQSFLGARERTGREERVQSSADEKTHKPSVVVHGTERQSASGMKPDGVQETRDADAGTDEKRRYGTKVETSREPVL